MNDKTGRMNDPLASEPPPGGAEDCRAADGLASLRAVSLPGNLRESNRARIRAALARGPAEGRGGAVSRRERRRAALVFGLAAGLAAVVALGWLSAGMLRGGIAPNTSILARPATAAAAAVTSAAEGTQGRQGAQGTQGADGMLALPQADGLDRGESPSLANGSGKTGSAGETTGGTPWADGRGAVATATHPDPGNGQASLESHDAAGRGLEIATASVTPPVGFTFGAGAPGAPAAPLNSALPSVSPSPLFVTPTATPPISKGLHETFSSLSLFERGRESADRSVRPGVGMEGTAPTPIPSGLPPPRIAGQEMVQTVEAVEGDRPRTGRL